MTTNKTRTILAMSIAATIILSGVALTSNTLTKATAQTATPTSPCPPNGQVEHWDKIIFTVNGLPATLQNLRGHQFDLKVLDQPNTVVDLNNEVLTSFVSQYGLSSQDAQNISIKIIDDKYETVTCGQTGPQGPAGPAGPPGPPGTSATVSYYNGTTAGNILLAPGQNIITSSCNPGDSAIGIQYALFGAQVLESWRSSPNIWTLILTSPPAGLSHIQNVNALCATP